MAIASSPHVSAQTDTRYDVGGILLDRPFKIRRLGHFGFNLSDMEHGLPFYRDLLGFAVSDPMDLAGRTPDPKLLEGLGDTCAYFTHHGTDHHSFVIFPKRIVDLQRPDNARYPEVTLNQITWQVGSMAEVGNAVSYFQEQGIAVKRSGRDTPGSNWHTYPQDPDGHLNELYYGIEQIGWDGFSKPRALYHRGFHEKPPLPQISEFDEIQQALESGVDLESGHRHLERLPRIHDVDGILLARPFKIVRVGPVRLFVEDVERSLPFYTQTLGLTVTEEVSFEGHRCVFLRAGLEHHSIALYPLALRQRLGLSPHTTCLSFGVQVANYRQLREALAFLRTHGVQIKELPAELFPGVDYSAFAIDPDGHAIQLYYYMEQVGPDGQARSPRQRRPPVGPLADWPTTLDPLPDTYLGEAYLGPWG